MTPEASLAGISARKLWMWYAAAAAYIAAIEFRYVGEEAIFPYYQKTYRGENFELAAKTILERARGHALYTTNVSASGLSVAANLDILRLPGPPIAWPPREWETGFVISYTPDPSLGRLVERYRLGGSNLYLLCRGAACDAR